MIRQRHCPPEAQQRLQNAGMQPVLARLLASRGIEDPSQVTCHTTQLLPPSNLLGIEAAAALIGQAIVNGDRICIVADYDCDGATACAVAIRGLHALGAQYVDFIVPNRFTHGYGLTEEIVQLATKHPRLGHPNCLITVDSGIASVSGVRAAKQAGMRVIITDHHLPGPSLPEADAIVNPNQPNCTFPSKFLAGVGVMFYVLIATRSHIRQRWPNHHGTKAPLQNLLDLVALGTVADLVPLDSNNRLLVGLGLQRIRNGRACAGLDALLQLAKRRADICTCDDLGFAVGPRINAAGRLSNMEVGIATLLTDDPQTALELAQTLSAINEKRRELQQTMSDEALAHEPSSQHPTSLVLHRPDWHEGIIGLVASRLKDRWNCPVVALACCNDSTTLRGSGRSIRGLHLRDVLDRIDKQKPELLIRFGGHAMAAGLTIHKNRLAEFTAQFEAAVLALADPDCFSQETLTDGPLAPHEHNLALLQLIESHVWGQAFPTPTFSGVFEITGQKLVTGKHLQLTLRQGNHLFDAIAFGRAAPIASPVHLSYRLLRNEFRGDVKVKLSVQTIEELPATVSSITCNFSAETSHPLAPKEVLLH